MIKASTFQLILILALFCLCHVDGGADEFDWLLHQKLQTIENSLIANKNLAKFVTVNHIDNDVFKDDDVKATRSYNNARCIADLQVIQANFYNTTQQWAFAMFDSWGKIPSGDYTGDLGNFRQCQRSASGTNDSIDIRSQYCVLEMYITNSPRIIKLKAGSARWGICIPNSCAPSLIQAIMNEYLNSTSATISIPAALCQFQDDNTKVFLLDVIVIIFIVLVLSLVVLGTIYDFCSEGKEKGRNPILTSFSLIKNGRILFSCKENASPNKHVITCFHGIRAISAQYILLGHLNCFLKVSCLNMNDYNDFQIPFAHIDGGVGLCVDTFFLLSGILLPFSILNHLAKTNGQLELRTLYLRRYLRLMPVLAFVAIIHLTLYKFVASGPSYPSIDYQRHPCEQSLWQSLFFISNYVASKCVGASWYLGVDMQLFLLAPFLVVLMKRNDKRFVVYSILAILINFVAIITDLRLTNFGWPRREYMYYTTVNRFAPWLIGLNFGYYLHKSRSKTVYIPKHLNTLALTVLLLIMGLLIYYNFSVSEVGMWIFRIVWSLALCYVIFACINGYGGVINSFLSLPQWQPLSRLSFVTFLIHQTVLIGIDANTQSGEYYSWFVLLERYLVVSGATSIIAAIISLTIEMPIAALVEKYWL